MNNWKRTDVLVQLVVHLPCHSEVIAALGRRSDDDIATLLLLKVLLCLLRVEVMEVRMFDDPSCKVLLRVPLPLFRLLVPVLAVRVPVNVVLLRA